MTHTYKRNLKRPILALSMAASIALSPLAVTPAQANNDHGKFLAGLVTLGLIGVIIENNAGRRAAGGQYETYRNVAPSKRIPSRCVKTYNSTGGAMTMFSKNCLRDHFQYWRSMPRQCAVQVQYRGNYNTYHNETAYRLPCLDNWGYQIISGH